MVNIRTNMATIEEIDALLEKKLETKLGDLRVQILNDIDEKWKNLIETNQKNIAANTASIEGLGLEIETHKKESNDRIDELERQLKESEQEIDKSITAPCVEMLSSKVSLRSRTRIGI